MDLRSRSWLVAGIAAALLAAAAPAAAAPALVAPSCVGYQGNTRTLPVQGSGFTPGAYVSVRYEAPHLGEPRSAALLTADAAGSFSTTLVPPSPASPRLDTGIFTLSALDPLHPDLFAATTFKVTRVRVTVRPRVSTDPGRVALFRAEGFEPGATVYAHFRRFGASNGPTVTLGRAGGACGRVSKRMALVPGEHVTPGSWLLAVDTERRFSRTTRPQAGQQIIVQRQRSGIAAGVR